MLHHVFDKYAAIKKGETKRKLKTLHVGNTCNKAVQ